MEIKLLSPENNAVIEIIPKNQYNILEKVSKINYMTENGYQWNNVTFGDNDNSFPQHIIFTWGYFGSLAEIERVVLYISKTNSFEECNSYTITNGNCYLSITNFTRNTQYFWKMAAFSSSEKLYQTEVRQFVTKADLPQWYMVEGATNIRDIGGWNADDGKTVKEKLLFRGSALDCYLDVKEKALDFLSSNLKIKTDLDLRSENQINVRVSPIKNANHIFIPLAAYGEIDTKEERQKIAEIFRVLADSTAYPIYLHCIAGADRTGTVVFLLKALLGVNERDIALDYELTSLSIFGIRSSNHIAYIELKNAVMSYGENLKDAAKNFLLKCGLTPAEIESIKNIFLA